MSSKASFNGKQLDVDNWILKYKQEIESPTIYGGYTVILESKNPIVDLNVNDEGLLELCSSGGTYTGMAVIKKAILDLEHKIYRYTAKTKSDLALQVEVRSEPERIVGEVVNL